MKYIAPKYPIAALCLLLALAGCGKREEDKRESAIAQPAASQSADKPGQPVYPADDVRRHFIAKAEPLLPENAIFKLWASSKKNDKPEILIKELDYPTLEYALDGTLFFIGGQQDAVIAIRLDKTSETIARSGVMGYAKPDDSDEKVPIYNTFENLFATKNGKLLTLKNGAYPFVINPATKEMVFQDLVLPTGEMFTSTLKMVMSNDLNWQFKNILSEDDWIILYNQPNKTWYRYKKGGKLERIGTPESLKTPDVYLRVTEHYGITGPDGYIYAVEVGKNKGDPDRVIRIGDPGLSSLREDASRVTLAEFKHGELTGALAFSPNGELAVGAENRIYLILPGTAKPSPQDKTP